MDLQTKEKLTDESNLLKSLKNSHRIDPFQDPFLCHFMTHFSSGWYLRGNES